MKASLRATRIFSIWIFLFQMLCLPIASADTTGSGSGSGSSEALSIEECNEDPSRQWNSARNLCVYTEESVTDRDEYRECVAIEDPDERKACHDKYARDRSGDPKEYEEDKMGLGIAAANAALAAINMFTKGGSSNCMSKTIHAGTAMAGVLAEAYFKFMASKEHKELAEKYSEETVNADPYAAQKRAFDFLEDQQNAIADYAGKRKTGYMLLTAGYTIAAGFAVYELMQPAAQSCTNDKKKGEDSTKSEDSTQPEKPDSTEPEVAEPESPAEELESGEVTEQSDVAETNDAKPDANSVEQKAAAAGLKGIMGNLNLGHPAAVLAISTVSALLSAKLMKAAAEQQEEAKTNAANIAKIKEKFMKALGNFCPSGHEDMSDPRCFCYTSDGDQNSNRTNSDICQNLWAQDTKSLFAEAGNYSSGAEAKAGCMTLDRQFDQNCKCKKFIDDNGQNACYKTYATTNSIPPNLQSAFSLPTVASALDSVNSGTAAGDVNANSIGRALAKAQKARDKMVDQYNKVAKAKGQQQLPSGSQLLNKFLKGSGLKAFQAAGKKSPDIAAAVPNNPAIAKAVKAAEEKSGIAAVGKGGSAEALGGTKKKKKRWFNLEEKGNKVVSLGSDPNQGAEYDYGENDINNDPDQNLFEIITRRYNISGLERLFDDE